MRQFSMLMATALASGCVSSPALVRQHNPDSEFEAGVVTISASAPMRWESVAGELRPEFNSQSAAAYVPQMLRATQSDFASRREATSAQFGVDVSGETVSRQETTNTNAEGESSTTGTSTRQQTAPTALRTSDGGQTVVADMPGPGGMFRSDDTPGTAWQTDGVTNVDPILQHRAAVALHQELVLLDNYLDNAFDPCRQEAWLVRTSVVSTPYARNQPLDVYTRVYGWYRREGDDDWDYSGMRIVPLLVTDNFERSDSRRYEQVAAQVRGSLSGLSGVVAAGLGFNRYLNNLNAVLGSQYNNLLTISQLDDVTLMVRLGAAFSPTSRYEMQSRSYDITFLVLIDRDQLGAAPVELSFFATSEMRNAETGALLPSIAASDRRAVMRLLRHELQGHEGDLSRIADFDRPAGPPERAQRILDELRYQDRISSDTFRHAMRWLSAVDGSSSSLSVQRSSVSLPPFQTGVFADTMTAGLTARVVGSPGLRRDDLVAELIVDGIENSADTFTLAASGLDIDPNGVIDATFPSVAALGVNPDLRRMSLRLRWQCEAASPAVYPLMRNRAVFAPAAATQVSFGASIVGGVTTISRNADSTGQVRVAIQRIAERNNPFIAGYQIYVEGGTLVGARRVGEDERDMRRQIDPAANWVRVGAEFGAYNLSLANLSTASDVTVHVRALGADGGLLTGEATEGIKVQVRDAPSATPQPPAESPG